MRAIFRITDGENGTLEVRGGSNEMLRARVEDVSAEIDRQDAEKILGEFGWVLDGDWDSCEVAGGGDAFHANLRRR